MLLDRQAAKLFEYSCVKFSGVIIYTCIAADCNQVNEVQSVRVVSDTISRSRDWIRHVGSELGAITAAKLKCLSWPSVRMWPVQSNETMVRQCAQLLCSTLPQMYEHHTMQEPSTQFSMRIVQKALWTSTHQGIQCRQQPKIRV